MMKGQKGITLIALIITIIVMLILVGVTISVALNGGLFKKAGEAVSETNAAKQDELKLDAENVTINGVEQNITDYVDSLLNPDAD